MYLVVAESICLFSDSDGWAVVCAYLETATAARSSPCGLLFTVDFDCLESGAEVACDRGAHHKQFCRVWSPDPQLRVVRDAGRPNVQ